MKLAYSDDSDSDFSVDEQSADHEGFILPWEHLSEEALRGVVEAALVAEVADQNVEGFELQREVSKVLTGLANGEWLLVFDPETETPSLRRPD